MTNNEIITERKKMLEAVKKDGNALQYADDTLKADREVVLEESQYADLVEVVNKSPESIYGPDYDDEDYEDIEEILNSVYWESITFVEKKLTELGFNVKESFSEYLD